MESQSAHERRAGALEDLVHGLGQHADEFTPAQRGGESGQVGLPGRHPGEHMPANVAPASTASTVILDCGTSRRSGYSHVLWISPSADTILGSHGRDRLGEAIGHMPGVSACEWDGPELLHLRASGADWSHLLESARAAVDELTAG